MSCHLIIHTMELHDTSLYSAPKAHAFPRLHLLAPTPSRAYAFSRLRLLMPTPSHAYAFSRLCLLTPTPSHAYAFSRLRLLTPTPSRAYAFSHLRLARVPALYHLSSRRTNPCLSTPLVCHTTCCTSVTRTAVLLHVITYYRTCSPDPFRV
jgi:hypothetical protein